MSTIWLALSIVLEVLGTLSLRMATTSKNRLWYLSVVVNYAVAFLFLSFSLAAGMPLGVAYGIWTAVGIVLIALLARVLWQDPLTKRILFGIALIVAGVILVELG